MKTVIMAIVLAIATVSYAGDSLTNLTAQVQIEVAKMHDAKTPEARKVIQDNIKDLQTRIRAVVDAQRQSHKSETLMKVENKFLAFCDMLSNTNTHAKLSFDAITEKLDKITDANTKVMISVQLLAIDAEAKREGGLRWWDSCVWHESL